jgi:murein DD-endopeptidase MepM/ murein hydrolase activator NlpD
VTEKRDAIRVSVAAAVAAAVLMLLGSLPAGAQSTAQRLDATRQRAQRVKSQYERIAQAYADQQIAISRTTTSIERTNSDIQRAAAEKKALQSQLRKRVRVAYQMGGLGMFDLLMNAKSFDEFTVRYSALRRQSLADEELILQLRRKNAELQAKEKQLRGQRAVHTSEARALREQARQLTVSFSEAQELVRDLQGQLRAEQIAQLFRVGRRGSGGGGSVPMDACPVQGPHVVNNDYGAPRGGGSRSHQGNDIMAPMGAPVVAAVNGVVRQRTGGLGGLAYHLQGSSALFYYAHLNDFVAPDGARVSAGQLIGHNGNTGDASGGAPHVHFEIHPGSGYGSTIDPNASLMQVC